MRPLSSALLGSLLASTASLAIPDQSAAEARDELTAESVSVSLFGSLERTARLVDIAYCVGTTGVYPPFACASRCKDFPTLHLVSTWNTGVLLGDSCGYLAVDHGLERERDGDRPHEPTIVLAFRGTYSITNTVVDLSTIPQEYVPYPAPDDGDGDSDGKDKPEHRCANCTVHAGFLASWRNARELVLPHLKAVRDKHPSYPVHIIGHSLGGAVAALAALELRLSLGWEDVTVTTFGEPLVGNSGFVAYLDAAFSLDKDDGYDPDLEERPYRRVTHAGDPVPSLPLEEWGFRPHAGEIYITKSSLQPAAKDVRLCRGDRDPRCIAGADGSASGAYRELIGSPATGEDNDEATVGWTGKFRGLPARLRLWELLFAHRDYFWRLGLCIRGGDPWDWGRDRYDVSSFGDEL